MPGPDPSSQHDTFSPHFPPLRTPTGGKRRVVGFDTSPSSVLRSDSPAGSTGGTRHDTPVESPLAAALKRERSLPQLPQLPKLRLGLKGGRGMPRSKSHGNLATQSAATAVPAAPRSATSSPHAASSGGSEPVRIPLDIPRRRRNGSVDATRQGTLTEAAQAEAVQAAAAEAAAEAEAEEVASTPIISAASSLLGQHLAGGPSGSASAAGSPASSVSGAAAAAMMRSQLSAKDLFVAQADAVMAHAQVQSLQTALRKEQEEVQRLRDQLQLMTAERDRLLTDLQQGGSELAPVFDMDHPAAGTSGAARTAGAAFGSATGAPAAPASQPASPPLQRPKSALRGLRLP